MTLAYIDTETTGLDPRIHQPWEVCWWLEDEPQPQTWMLPHTLEHADQQALAIGGYWDRRRAHEDADAALAAVAGLCGGDES